MQEDYYEKLTDIAQGISNVAGDLWWRSLKIENIDADKISSNLLKTKDEKEYLLLKVKVIKYLYTNNYKLSN